MLKIKQYFRRRAWLRKHRDWEDTRQKRKALEKYLNQFNK